jgi:nucleotide-binding universal stress UspA family protein
VDKIRQAAEEAAQQCVRDASDGQPASLEVKAVSGQPATELIEASRDADLVVVGSRGGGGFARLLLGSVSNQVVEHALCPVTVVPHDR